MSEKKAEEEAWETPSLEWLHRIRRESQAAREGRPVSPVPRERAEELARRYGLKLAQPVPGARR